MMELLIFVLPWVNCFVNLLVAGCYTSMQLVLFLVLYFEVYF